MLTPEEIVNKLKPLMGDTAHSLWESYVTSDPEGDGPGGDPEFVAAPPLTDQDVQHISETTATRVVRLLQRRGLLEQDSEDSLWQDEPLLASLTAASVQGTVATGERAGQRIRRRLVDPKEGIRGGSLCFSSRGFSLHAATRIEADDRSRLERLCRYVIRPPLAAGKLRVLDEETLSFTLKTPWSDGTTHLVLSPLELIEKLAALVPPPRLNLVRYHGVLAPNAASRDRIVPGHRKCLRRAVLTPSSPRHPDPSPSTATPGPAGLDRPDYDRALFRMNGEGFPMILSNRARKGT